MTMAALSQSMSKNGFISPVAGDRASWADRPARAICIAAAPVDGMPMVATA